MIRAGNNGEKEEVGVSAGVGIWKNILHSQPPPAPHLNTLTNYPENSDSGPALINVPIVRHVCLQ